MITGCCIYKKHFAFFPRRLHSKEWKWLSCIYRCELIEHGRARFVSIFFKDEEELRSAELLDRVMLMSKEELDKEDKFN